MFEIKDATIIARGVHIHGEDGVDTNSLGYATLRKIAQGVLDLEEFRYVEAIVIEGAERSTGANPGRTPKPMRFRRALDPTWREQGR